MINNFGLDPRDEDQENDFLSDELKSQQNPKKDGSEVRMFIQTDEQSNDGSETRF